MNQFKKIIIIGSSSTGKSTLALAISKKLKIPHQELDAFYWEENWTRANTEQFRQRVEQFTNQTHWVLDGNFQIARDLIWPQATHIIWLDYNLPIILYRFFIRSIRRSLFKEKLWNNNRETIWGSMICKDSLFLWILKTYKRNKKNFSQLLEEKSYPQARFIRLKSPQDTKVFLSSI